MSEIKQETLLGSRFKDVTQRALDAANSFAAEAKDPVTFIVVVDLGSVKDHGESNREASGYVSSTVPLPILGDVVTDGYQRVLAGLIEQLGIKQPAHTLTPEAFAAEPAAVQ